MESKIYKTPEEIKNLTEKLAKTTQGNKAVGIDSANLVSRLPPEIISDEWKKVRKGCVEDSGKYQLSGLLTADALYLSVFHPDMVNPIVFELKGDELNYIPR